MKGQEIEEIKFTKWFEKVGRVKILRGEKNRNYADFWKREFVLFDPYATLKRDFYEIGSEVKKKSIGRIDVVFRFRAKLWVGEVKYYQPHGNEFWDACKILAYCAYYNWQNEAGGGFDNAFPAILIPKKSVKLQHKITANKLKIMIIGIEKTSDGYILEEMTTPLYG